MNQAVQFKQPAAVSNISSDEVSLIQSVINIRDELTAIREEQRDLALTQSQHGQRIDDAKNATRAALTLYTSAPSPANKEALTAAREHQQDFESGTFNYAERTKQLAGDISRLASSYDAAYNRLIAHRKTNAASGLQAELEQLKTNLNRDLARFLVLTAESLSLPVSQLDLQRTIESQLPGFKSSLAQQSESLKAQLRDLTLPTPGENS